MNRIAALTVTLICAFTHAVSAKPNIVFILVDDMGHGDLSC